jgi:transposase-like protein
MRTSTCQLHFRWRRLRCSQCGRTFIPLRQWLGLERWQRKTTALEKLVIETVCDQSYRRSTQHLEAIGHIPVARSTAHRWVAESACDQCDKPTEAVQTLFVDGTGFKRRPTADKNNRGEVRIAVGLTKEGQAVPLGSWSGRTWEEIGLDLKKFQDPPQPLAEILVSDQETGLAEALAGLFNRTQGCHWHLVRDLGHQLWKEDAPLPERKRLKKELAGILAIEIPEDEVQPIEQSEKNHWKEKIRTAENELEDLAKKLGQKNWHRVAEHVRSVKSRLFGYLEFWLETGLFVPRTNSFMERLMRELGRRIKRIGFGWTEEGAARMCRILIRRITEPEAWEQWWKEKLGIVDNVIFTLREMKLLTTKPA